MIRTTSEAERSSRVLAFSAAGAMAATFAIFGAGLINESMTDPVRAYDAQFTHDGSCLDKSVFDAELGADIHISAQNIGKKEILQVTPVNANDYQPSVLFLQVESNGPFSRPTLTMADHYAGAILVHNGCIGEKSGQ